MAELIVIGNSRLCGNYYIMRLQGDNLPAFKAGQFININCGTNDGILLKRPISVFDKDEDIITLVYEVKGKGTKALAEMKSGDKTEALCFLGNGFDIKESDRKIMLIGGGMGVAPLYSVIKQYNDREFYAFLGYGSSDRIILEKEFSDCNRTVITTDDGSYGVCGYITPCALSYIEEIKPDLILACGPKPMLKGLKGIENIRVQVSVEERMGCGIGACLVCVCKTTGGNKRVCKDGPVFDIKEVEL